MIHKKEESVMIKSKYFIFFMMILFGSVDLAAQVGQKQVADTLLVMSRKNAFDRRPKQFQPLLNKFYYQLSDWKSSLSKLKLPDRVTNNIRINNFLIQDIRNLENMKILIVRIGLVKDPDVQLEGVKVDSTTKEIMFSLEPLRDPDYVLTLADENGKSYSMQYIHESNSQLQIEIEHIDKDNEFLHYELNKSPFGGSYSLVHLVILNIQNNHLKMIFDKPILEINPENDIDYKYICQINKEQLILIKNDRVEKKSTIEKYIYKRSGYIQHK
jgi:hypothetical protein